MNWKIHQTIDLLRGFVDVNTWPESLMLPGDDAAHVLEVEIKSGEQPVDLTGCSSLVYFNRADKAVVILPGIVSGNTVSVTFDPSCYAIPGQLRTVMKVTNRSGILTACETYFMVRAPLPDQVIDPGTIVPSIEVLMAKLQQMTDVTAAANEATDNANAAADRANAAADKLNWDFVVTDDDAGNVTLSGLVDVMDDNNGNVTIGPFASATQ